MGKFKKGDHVRVLTGARFAVELTCPASFSGDTNAKWDLLGCECVVERVLGQPRDYKSNSFRLPVDLVVDRCYYVLHAVAGEYADWPLVWPELALEKV